MTEKEQNEKLITIAVDAMGGDDAPEEIVKGAARASLQTPTMILLFGDGEKIEKILHKHEHDKAKIVIKHTDQYISGDDSPKETIQQRPKASILLAAQAVGGGKAEALVAAGNTGAVILAARKYIPRIVGVRKTAIATVYPTLNYQKREDYFGLILDVGANIENSVDELVQFAYMGNIYASDIKGISSPTVALLNNGKEPYKGGDKYSRVYQILSDLPEINFIGNIEGNDLMKGVCDVVVTEGFIGNILMKTVEGLAETLGGIGREAFRKRFTWKLGMIALSSGIKRLKRLTDYREYGGAPVLGFQKMVIKSHGRSNDKAISNAIKLAAKSVRDSICERITEVIQKYESTYSRSFSDI